MQINCLKNLKNCAIITLQSRNIYKETIYVNNLLGMCDLNV